MAQLPVNKIKNLTEAQRDAQTSNEVGDLIYNSTAGSLEVNKDGATNWSKVVDAENPASEQLVYISNLGSDATGNGSETYPWATASYALSQITDNSVSKPYKIIFIPGSYTDTTIALKNYVYFEGNQSIWTITNPLVLDSSFSAGGLVYCNNFYLIYNVAGSNLDFNALTPGASCTLNFQNCGFVIPSFTAVGADSNQCIITIDKVNAVGTTFTLSNLTFESTESTIYRFIHTKNSTAQPNQSIKLYTSFITSTASSTVNVAETIVFRSWGSKWQNALTLTTTGSGVINADNFASQYDVAPVLDGAGVTFVTAPLSVTPSVANGATLTYRTIADTIDANITPSNYTPTNDSVKGNLAGIDTALGAITSASLVAVQVFLTDGTYTPTVGATKALVYLTGAGGGGGGAGVSGTGQTNGGVGESSLFGAIFAAAGGAGGEFGTNIISGDGGVGSNSAGGTYMISGSGGTTGYLCGGAGGSSYAGGGAAAKAGNTQTGYNAVANSGAGGGGGTYVSYSGGGGGGGATGVYLYTTLASQSVTIGVGGTAGAAGTSGGAGGIGGSGKCVILEFA